MPEVVLDSKAHNFCWVVAAVKLFGSVDPKKLSINIWNPQKWRWMVQMIFLVGGETTHLKNICQIGSFPQITSLMGCNTSILYSMTL